MDKKKCFLISPIGAEGSAIREHADDVFDFIIMPAMREVGMEAIRSDRLNEPGQISDVMLRHIFEDDLCIAILTGNNPNVFYELALAQAAARPLILMMEKGGVLPFDVKDHRCIYYDLRPRSIHDGVFARELVDHIMGFVNTGWVGVFPFGNRSPLGYNEASMSEGVTMATRTVDTHVPDKYLLLLREANEIFCMSGLALNIWSRIRMVTTELRNKAAEGCKIRIMIMDPENPINHQLVSKNQSSPVLFKQDLHKMETLFKDISENQKNIEFRTIKKGCLHARIHITDSLALYDPYFYNESNDYTPLWEAKKGSSLYTHCKEEFDAIWEENTGN